MSKSFDSFKIYPINNNEVVVKTTQTNWDINASENKVIVRAPDHHAFGLNTVHASAVDGYRSVVSTISTDPLVVEISGVDITKTIDGYDGLLVNAVGSSLARGVIKSTAISDVEIYEGGASLSINDHHYLLGGYNSADGYVNHIWHSVGMQVWLRLNEPPWAARAGHWVVSDGSSVWVGGGQTGDGVSLTDVWRADFESETGVLVWEGAAIDSDTSIDLYTKYAFDSDVDNVVYHKDGYYNIDTDLSATKDFGVDGYDHMMYYDVPRHMLWVSKDGVRQEWIYDLNQDEVGKEDLIGYTHTQSSAASTWTINHNLQTTNVAFIVRTTYGIYEPSNAIWASDNRLDLIFPEEISGTAWVMLADAQSGTTWSMDGYDAYSAWWGVSSAGEYLIDPDIINNGSALELSWTQSYDGYITTWNAFNGINVTGGRKYSYTGNISHDANVSSLHDGSNIMHWANRNNGEFLELDMTFTTASENRIVTTSGINEDGYVHSINMRHAGYKTNAEIWGGTHTYASLGYNSADRDDGRLFILLDNASYISTNAGCNWTAKTSPGAADDRIQAIWVSTGTGRLGVTLNDGSVTLSLDSGASWTQLATGLLTLIVTYHGDLGVIPDDTWNIFIYERPSDVAWESNYGAMPVEVRDKYTTHYILPYPAVVTGTSTRVTFTLDTVYGRAATAGEFKDHYLHYSDELYRINDNTAASAGNAVDLIMRDELPEAPTGRIQILKPRPERITYYTGLTLNETKNHVVWREDDGTAIIPSKEQAEDFYSHRKIEARLPAFIENVNAENAKRVDVYMSELERQRVKNNIIWYDPYAIPTAELKALSTGYGLDLSSNGINLKNARHAVKNWFSLVDAYGGCVDGLKNISELLLGTKIDVTLRAGNKYNNAVSLGISSIADESWTWTSDNKWTYDGTSYGLAVNNDSLNNTTLSTHANKRIIHIRDQYISLPVLITETVSGDVVNTLRFTVDNDDIVGDTYDSSSKFLIVNEQDARTLYKFIEIITSIMPWWAERYYT